MYKFTVILGMMVLALAVESSSQRIIFPTYRPPPRPRQPIIRTVRDTSRVGPLRPYEDENIERAPSNADHPSLPHVIDDVTPGATRHARSLSTPGRGRIGSNDRGSHGTRGHDTGATHLGHNRRNTRSIHLPLPDFVTTPPFNPKPWPEFPQPHRPRLPIYA